MISVKKLANKNYQGFITTRDNVYAGKLIAPINPDIEPIVKYYDQFDNELSGNELTVKGKVNRVTTGGDIYRKMLFSLNEYDLANDLLYTSPNYYIRGIEPKVLTPKDIMIGEYYNLEELLIYFKFKKELTFEDIKKIYRLFLKNDHFLYENAEIFGLTLSKKFGNGYSSTGKEHPFPTSLLEKLSKLTTYNISPPYTEKQKIMRR